MPIHVSADVTETHEIPPFRYPRIERHLKAILIGALLLINAAVIVYAALSLERSRAAGMAEAAVRTKTVAYAVDQGISSSVDTIDHSLQTVVHEMEWQRRGHFNGEHIRLVLEDQTRLLPEAAGFRITDENGRVIFGIGENSRKNLNLADRDYFLELRKENRPGLVVSKPVSGHVSGKWIIPFARSYRTPDGRFAGIVSVPISIDFFNRMLVRFDVGPGGNVSLRDKDLGLIARYPTFSATGELMDVGSNNVSQAMRDRRASGIKDSTYNVLDPYDQTMRVNTFARITNAPFYVIAGVSQTVYLKGWHRELLQTVVFMLAFILVTSLLAWMVYRAWRGQAKGNVALRERNTELANTLVLLRESQEQVEHMAYHDRLTGLPNRALLAERLRLALAQADRDGTMLGVCYLDLDGFKPINDDWGHDAGDALLFQVGQRLQEGVRGGNTVARIGGDEFVVLIGNVTNEGELIKTLQRLLDAIARPFRLNDWATASLTMSVGVAIWPQESMNEPDMLIRHADHAMYVAKRTGRNRIHVFDPAAERRLRERIDLQAGIQAGLERNEFVLYYQPKVNMRTGAIIGAEALIRWEHPIRGLLMPAAFLSAVEDNEQAIVIGEWVLRAALRQMQAWKQAGLELTVSVNIFGRHLQCADFAERLGMILGEFPDVDPARLELELLETTVMEDIDEMSIRLNECGALGVGFALDDFGTGYSSLAYLRRLPTRTLKVDQSFVIDMLTNPDDKALVQAIIAMAHTFKREVIAEGVESIAHGDALLALGCDLAQGFGIAKPMPAAHFTGWANEWTPPESWAQTPLHTPA
ncbi:MAG TPA: EAL domain-containing protein [Rhodocyclaceae bacterium]|nr:EAL domain-containing protein [Rhodocyclaceae bacterium]